MNEPFQTVRASAIQRQLDQQAKIFRDQTAAARKELRCLMETIVSLRRNPLARPFLNGSFLEQVRGIKRLLSQEVSLSPAPHESDGSGEMLRHFAFSSAELAEMTPEQAAIVGRTAATLVAQNLGIPYDLHVAAVSTGTISKETFTYVGVEWLNLMIRHCRLAPSHSVLDIGCGCGRMAGPLTMYLNAEGSYRGFDPVRISIDYAQTHLSQSNFHFEFVDLRHYLYNPKGVIDPSTYRFPCEDSSIDVSLAGSIFTHLDLKTASHYLEETSRVLRPGGRALYSLFALVDDMVVPEGEFTKPLGQGEGAGLFRFLNRGAGFYTHCDANGAPKNHFYPDSVGDPVAFDRQKFTSMAAEAALRVDDYLPGGWCDREYQHGYQDMFVLRKPK